jgi:hypothetical protein
MFRKEVILWEKGSDDVHIGGYQMHSSLTDDDDDDDDERALTKFSSADVERLHTVLDQYSTSSCK